MILEWEEDGGVVAIGPALQGCVSQQESRGVTSERSCVHYGGRTKPRPLPQNRFSRRNVSQYGFLNVDICTGGE